MLSAEGGATLAGFPTSIVILHDLSESHLCSKFSYSSGRLHTDCNGRHGLIQSLAVPEMDVPITICALSAAFRLSGASQLSPVLQGSCCFRL